jgi:hypothetical protein
MSSLTFFLAGCFTGVIIGFLVSALCGVARESDDAINKILNGGK